MLELCFDMSTRGALRVAQRCGGSGRKGLGFVLSRTEDGGNVTSTTVIGSMTEKRPRERRPPDPAGPAAAGGPGTGGHPLGGSPSDVLVLSLGLMWGISENRWVRTGGTCCAGGVMVMMRPRTGTGSGIWRQRSD